MFILLIPCYFGLEKTLPLLFVFLRLILVCYILVRLILFSYYLFRALLLTLKLNNLVALLVTRPILLFFKLYVRFFKRHWALRVITELKIWLYLISLQKQRSLDMFFHFLGFYDIFTCIVTCDLYVLKFTPFIQKFILSILESMGNKVKALLLSKTLHDLLVELLFHFLIN